MEHLGQGLLDTNRGALTGAAEGVDYYRVLDVDHGASRIEIREAYLRLKSTFAAGSAALYSLISEEEATEQLAQVEEAFRVLNDEVARRDYDDKRGTPRPRRSGAALTAKAAASGPDADVAGLHAERLLYARGQTEAAAEQIADSARIRTTRSSLPIIKLKASGAGAGEMQAKLAALVAAGDPGDGDLFKRLREAAAVGEDEMCERTKICINYLRAIEANRFDRLPQAVYVKGFLRSYCRYLGMPDAEKLVAAFSARLTDWQANRKG